jgi:LmbE family N-acetylglucosaminyl deacetylase
MTTAEVAPATTPDSTFPSWESLLAVVAHPDDESFGLGAVLDRFASAGARVCVLCLTKGEASTVGAVSGDLAGLRAMELQNAARTLGLEVAILADHEDGALAAADLVGLAAEVSAVIDRVAPEGLVVFDPSGVTGHPDHAVATAAAMRAAEERRLPVLGWTIPVRVAAALNDEFGTSFTGHEVSEIDVVLPVDRHRQRVASLAHASQAVPTSVLWRRLELLGDLEHLRWLGLRTAVPNDRSGQTIEPG